MIPIDLKQQIDLLEVRATTMYAGRRKIALFDLDNTLLIGDIGEAVFAQLIVDGVPLDLNWSNYQTLLHRDAAAAYQRVVTAMKGLSVRTVGETTMKVLRQTDSSIRLGDFDVPIPRPHPVMRQLVLRLRDLGYDIYVISASNQISVRLAVAHHFYIPAERAFGIQAETINGILSADLVEPVPIHSGKVQVYSNVIGTTAPLITASDSLIDTPMLGLTDSMGLSVWVGTNRAEFDAVKERLGRSQRICFVQRPENQILRKSVRVFGEQRRIVVASAGVSAEA